jgi:hypothetical protein
MRASMRLDDLRVRFCAAFDEDFEIISQCIKEFCTRQSLSRFLGAVHLFVRQS